MVSETEALEQALDDLDPSSVEVVQTLDLRDVAAAADASKAAEAALREAVMIARMHRRSWTEIGVALGVSRQAARQRFAELVRH